MSNHFTECRMAVIGSLQNDSRFDYIKTWYEHKKGLRKRYQIDDAHSPYLAVYPQEVNQDEPTNAMKTRPYGLRVESGHAGQDAGPVEQFAWDFLDWFSDRKDDHLGLGDTGLSSLQVDGAPVRMLPRKKAPKIIWVARFSLTFTWRISL